MSLECLANEEGYAQEKKDLETVEAMQDHYCYCGDEGSDLCGPLKGPTHLPSQPSKENATQPIGQKHECCVWQGAAKDTPLGVALVNGTIKHPSRRQTMRV